ncbi:hypothetical protein FPRO05_10939 [Fusarium proliferatum]|uniref:Uncharacterized protein n=1 Tax=Gibberella intermedia TaxID=948311 RepID=A0A365NAT6_GIBIN|nr:hypothetical protein FPRO05_10939 [Fusarium proliferatum]
MTRQRARSKTTSQDDITKQRKREAKKDQAKARREERMKCREKAEKKRYAAALKAVERAEKGNLLNDCTYHAKPFHQYIAQSRYETRTPFFTGLSIKSIVRLARSFKFQEWQIIEQQPDWLNRVMPVVEANATNLENWFVFWSSIHASNIQWGNCVLVEITCDLFKGSTADLVDSVLCVSKGALPEIKDNSSDDQVETRLLSQQTPSQNIEPPATTLSGSASSWHTTVLEPVPITETELAAWAKSQLSQYIKDNFQDGPGTIAALHRRITNLGREYVLDLHSIMTGAPGLNTRNMKEIFLRAWGEMENSDGFQLERLLGLSRTVCLAMKIAHKGDYTLELKVPRNAALMIIKEFRPHLHVDPLDSSFVFP